MLHSVYADLADGSNAAAGDTDALSEAAEDLGDSPWLQHFVRQHSSKAIVFPSAHEKARRDRDWHAARAAEQNRLAAQTPSEAAVEKAVAQAYICGLVNATADRVVDQLEQLSVLASGPAPPAPARQSLLSLLTLSQDQVLRWREPGCGAMAAVQLRVHQQRKNSSCGYYSLHNGLTCMEALLHPDKAAAANHMATLQSGVAFWRRYWKWTHMLAAHARKEGNRYSPWRLEDVSSGTMERAHMLLLCECLNDQYKGHGSVLVPLPEATSVLTGGSAEWLMLELDRNLQAFITTVLSTMVVLLGAVNHWIAVVFHKVDGVVELLVLNSVNDAILDATDEELWENVQVWADRRRRHRQPFPKHEQLLYFQQMNDLRHAVELLADYAIGRQALRDRWLCSGLERVLQSFEDVVGPLHIPCDPPALSAWLSSHYHPRLLEEMTVDRFASPVADGWILGETLLQQLSIWLQGGALGRPTDEYTRAGSCDVPFLERFLATRLRLGQFLEAVGFVFKGD